MEGNRLSLKEVQYLIVNKPLVIVRLEHSERNKKMIVSAIKAVASSRNGRVTCETLREFLSNVAPKYDLTRSQNGARVFLLRELQKQLDAPKDTGLFSSLAAIFKTARA